MKKNHELKNRLYFIDNYDKGFKNTFRWLNSIYVILYKIELDLKVKD